MIKIILDNPHWLDKQALIETAKYLEALAKIDIMKSPEPAPRVETAVNPVPPVAPAPESTVPPVPAKVWVVSLSEPEQENFNSDELVPPAPVVPPVQPVPPVPDAAAIFAAPVPPVLPVLPVLPVPPVPPTLVIDPVSSDVDSSGKKWNEKIHTRAKTKNEDGTWKYRRDVSKKMIDAIENPAAPSIPMPPMLEPEKVLDFQALMSFVSSSLADGLLQREDIVRIMSAHAVPSVALAANHPEKIPSLMKALKGVVDARL